MTVALTYDDPENGTRGWLAYDGLECRLAAGGCRVQAGLAPELLETLAGRMTLKERVLGINVDGAKCGIELDPASSEKHATLRRFLRFLRMELATRLSLGCDMGTQWHELEELAALEGIPSVKDAVRRAQGLSEGDFHRRLATLDEPAGPLTLGERRAGHALAHATVRAARGVREGGRELRVAMQGFGTLGRAAACSLDDMSARIVALGDEHGCVASPEGLDVPHLLGSEWGASVERALDGRRAAKLSPDAIFELPCDVLVLASVEGALPAAQVDAVAAPVVVVGANCGLSADVEELLHRRGVVVVPDFIGGIGGSASMEVVFGSDRPLEAPEILDAIGSLMTELVDELFVLAERGRVTVRDAAIDLAASRTSVPDERPYGCCPFVAVAVR